MGSEGCLFSSLVRNLKNTSYFKDFTSLVRFSFKTHMRVKESMDYLDVIGEVPVEAEQVRERIEGAPLFVQKERQVEERAPEAGLGRDGLLEPGLGVGGVAVVHGQHAQVEVDPKPPKFNL